MSGRLVILSGPSGVGKDSVLDRWKTADPRVVRVVAYCTRAPRTGEVDGVDYHFCSREQFIAKADAGDFLEYKEVHGNLYATPLKDMEKLLADGRIAVLKIYVQGAISVMEKRDDAISIFLLAPSFQELERRIRKRGTDDEATIQKRLKNARDEIALSDRYQYRVVNDDIDRAVAEIMEIVK
ncbi:MAG: guanylate kinase [Rhodocyclaceae bacterium]|nr:MAG: guanylate kinase [Rhodocyclaceae bacterium]